ncbi:hypothetical protein LKK83_08175 [Phormidium sp. CCY1219]|nr:hypothetical protein [Phormidium sp. CCY1219]
MSLLVRNCSILNFYPQGRVDARDRPSELFYPPPAPTRPGARSLKPWLKTSLRQGKG